MSKRNPPVTIMLLALLGLAWNTPLSCADGELYVGTSKQDITPAVGIKLAAGYGGQEPPLSQGNHDPLFVRTLVLEAGEFRMAIVACDLSGYANKKIAEVARERFGISRLLLSSSHTHSVPSARDAESPYARRVEQAILRGLGESVEHMFPARVSAGYRSFPQLGYHRLIRQEDGRARALWENPDRVPYGPVDPEVGVIKFEDRSGRPRLILVNYACHPVVVMRNYEVSADYPGVTCKLVEEAYGDGALCMFIQGAAGDINPMMMSRRRRRPEDVTDYGPMETMGSLLAREVLRLTKSLKTPLDGPATLKAKPDSLRFHGRFDKKLTYDVHFTTILINDAIAIATFPGEPFVKFQLDWKKSAAAPFPFFFGYTLNSAVGDNPHYVPDIRSAAYGGYGADSSSRMIEVGAGEAVMNRHLENLYRLRGIMREKPGRK